MGWLKQETAYERKIRELEEEAERIRKNMQSILKNVDRASAPSRAVGAPPIRSHAPGHPADRRIASPVQAPAPAPADSEYDDTNGSDVFENSERAPVANDDVPSYGPARLRHNQAPKPEKLANYLASGSFGKRGSLTHERKIQRNKAIFMLILALLAVVSLIISLK